MPSSIGHGLAAIAAGWAIARPAARPRALVIQTAGLAVLGMAADLDLLVGRHSMETHSLGAAAIVASVAAWWRWPLAEGRWRIWLAAFAAWATHPLLDSLAPDKLPPIGIMAFWPISSKYFNTGLSVFAPISRRAWFAGFFRKNALPVVREILILAPVAWVVWLTRRRQAGFADCVPGEPDF
jgi:membrane-bound metal-dependent hydrolase YbcI (DUF457 family)